MTNTKSDAKRLQSTHKSDVDDWENTILRDEVFASATSSVAQIDRWE